MYRQEKEITWLGDSLEVLQGFPASVRVALGGDLRRLQIGEPPLDSKPVKKDIDIAKERLKYFKRI